MIGTFPFDMLSDGDLALIRIWRAGLHDARFEAGKRKLAAGPAPQVIREWVVNR